MNIIEKNNLIIEAERQSEALKRIARWRSMALLVSAIGIAVAFMGFGRESINILCGASGILMVLAGSVMAVIFNLGVRNGRANVERILDAVGRG